MDIFELLSLAVNKRVSDMHLITGNPPIGRIHGTLYQLNDNFMADDDIRGFLSQLGSKEEIEEFEQNLELDFGYTMPGACRLRVNVAMERGSPSMVIRMLPLVIPTLDDLHLPNVCKDLALQPHGLVIVSGPTGSGKSSTLAAMINHLNLNEGRRVVTIEDPIEYVHSNCKCVITQRELGADTLTFVEALRHVLRQDPDVILVGEVRDLETAKSVLAIAETGHLVLTTGHGASSVQAIERVIDLFPSDERHLAQSRLATLLNGVLCQSLVPKADGSGRVPAIEIMLASPAVRSLIRDGKIYQLPNAIRTQAGMGMALFDQALVALFNKGQISNESLFAFCQDSNEVAELCGKHGAEKQNPILAGKHS